LLFFGEATRTEWCTVIQSFAIIAEKIKYLFRALNDFDFWRPPSATMKNVARKLNEREKIESEKKADSSAEIREKIDNSVGRFFDENHVFFGKLDDHRCVLRDCVFFAAVNICVLFICSQILLTLEGKVTN